MEFEVIPAVDILEGKVVRLYRGDYNIKKVYSLDPVETICRFVDMGFKRIHVVDLDGAKAGRPRNAHVLKSLKCDAIIQFGGGLRKLEDVESVLSSGIQKVVLSSVFFDDIQEFRKIVNRFKDRVILSFDVENGYIKIHGWMKKMDAKISEIIAMLDEYPVNECIVTDISRDGTLTGCNLKLFKDVRSVTRLKVFASGGINGLDDIRSLKRLRIDGVILGKAVYEGILDLNDLKSWLQKE